MFQGLRICVLIGSLGGCIGSWIKVVGSGRDKFVAVFVGQAIVAASQVFILGMPAQLAATWFPASQVSSACAIGVFGNQVNLNFQSNEKLLNDNFGQFSSLE